MTAFLFETSGSGFYVVKKQLTKHQNCRTLERFLTFFYHNIILFIKQLFSSQYC